MQELRSLEQAKSIQIGTILAENKAADLSQSGLRPADFQTYWQVVILAANIIGMRPAYSDQEGYPRYETITSMVQSKDWMIVN